jgi:L-asparagine oxygenase
MVHVVRPREETIIDPLAKIPRLTLDDEVARALGRELQKLGSPYKDPHGMGPAAFQAVIAHLPRGVLQHLMRMRCEPEMPGALVIKNLPIDILLPRTPADGGVSREKKTFVSEGTLSWVTRSAS